jgi:hypothetical protein
VISTRIQLRLIALFYFIVAALKVIAIVTIKMMASQASSGSLAEYSALRASQGFFLTVATAAELFVLSGLSLQLPKLSRPTRIAAVALSLLISLSQIARATRETLVLFPMYSKGDYEYLAVAMAVSWAWPLAYSLCSYLLWKQLENSNNRSSGHAAWF